MANEFPLLNPLLQSAMDCGGFTLTSCGGITLSAGQVTLFQDPSAANHATRKSYVDTLITGVTLVAGNGIVVSGGAIHFAQSGAYTADQIPFASGAAAMGFSADLSWDDAGKIMTVNGGIKTVDYVDFDTGAAAAHVIGRLHWNDTDKTLETQVSSDTILQIGQEDHIYATNDSGSPIANGKVVQIVGAVLGRAEIALADNTSQTAIRKTVGITTEAIADGTQGFVTVRGFVRDMDTSSWLEGDLLYVGAAGALTNVKPTKPTSASTIAIVITVNALTGVIYVIGTDVISTISELTDVNLAGLADKQYLRYDSVSGTWLPTALIADNTMVVEGVFPRLYLYDNPPTGFYERATAEYNNDKLTFQVENLAPPSIAKCVDFNFQAVPTYTEFFPTELRCQTLVPGEINQKTGTDALINLIGGGVFQVNTGNTTVVSASSTWYELTGPYTSGGTNGITLDTTNGRLTPTVAGTYFVMWSLSFSMGSSNQDVEMAILKNGPGSPQNYGRGWRKVGTGADVGNANGHGLVAMNGTTDYVSLGIKNNTSTANLVTTHMQLTAFRVGE